MGKYEVTQAQFRQVMGKSPSMFRGDDRPVERVSWRSAEQFCQALAGKLGRTYRVPLRLRQTLRTARLPTEAEWEYACRAGTSTPFYTGSSESDLSRAAWWIGNSGEQTHSAGQKEANAWGLHDMLGNVYEWCADWYDESYYAKSPTKDPAGPPSGATRVVRGGYWRTGANRYRIAARHGRRPNDTSPAIGFRVCLAAR